MSTFALFVLMWLALTAALLAPQARVLRALWREPVFARPVVIIESDDWGPGPASDALMLRRIAEQLADICDREGRPALMTLGVVLGKPDGAAILADDCQRYHRRLLDEDAYAPIVEAMRAGCNKGVFSVQRHGLEHFWPASLLGRARDDLELRRWLADPDARSERLSSALQSRWVDSTVLPSSALPDAEIEAAVREEGEVFERIFGERPKVAVPNTFVWSAAVERAWAADGVRCVVSCGRQYEGRSADGGLMPPTRELFNAQHGFGDIRYLVRDVYFEPVRGHRAEQVWQGVAERTALGRPALIETHRESFIAAQEPAEQALNELVSALRGVVRRHPSVCFLSPAALVDTFGVQYSPLLHHGAALRLTFFLRRLLASAVLSRALKLSGLRFLIPLLIRVLTTVESAQDTRRVGC